MDAGKTIRKALLTAKSIAGNVGVRPAFAEGGGAQADMQPDEIQPRALNPLGLYSAAAEAARALPQKAGTAQQMIASLKGVKPDELKWSGVNERWKPTDKITRDDLAQHFEQGVPNVQESMLGDASGLPDPRFKSYSTPGGANYREALLLHVRKVNRLFGRQFGLRKNREENGCKNCDDRDNDQQFDQCKS